MKTKVYFTVDVEASMGGAWDDPERRPVPAELRTLCEIDGKSWGMGLLIEEMDRYGMRSTCFTETLASYCLGEDDTRAVIDYLLKHRQDVQLHTHPTYRFYADYLETLSNGGTYDREGKHDQIARLPEALQLELLEQATEVFVKLTGVRPTAYRAGGYGADQSTLRVLGRLGIPIDSSHNPGYKWNASFAREPLEPNLVQQVDGVWELPVMVARSAIPENPMYDGFKVVDPSAVSYAEIRMVLEQAHDAGMEHVVLMFHPFSTVKPRNVSYSVIRPNRVVISRLRRMFRFLAENDDRFTVTTVGELAAEMETLDRPQRACVPHLGLIRPALRKVVQGVNDLYWI